ncbi:MAG: TonB-dependent receptor [Desulfobaccales bacterium]
MSEQTVPAVTSPAKAGQVPKNPAQTSGAGTSGGAPAAGAFTYEIGQLPKGTEQLPEILVEERSTSMLGIADSSSQGTVGSKEIQQLPISRPGEVLETVPGLIVTQHSADGKANQYFLRGFNLDHGTDIAVFVNGVPINLPTNAHGQGYTDLNFLIPELIQKIDYQKGPYFANVGDFGSAGSVFIDYFKTLPTGIAKVEYGSWNYERGLLADSVKLGPGNLLFALETVHTDGPWVTPENYMKYNGVMTYSQGTKSEGFSVTAMGYNAPTWTATNQIPERAVAEGLVSRFGNLSPTDGGFTDRYTLEGEWHQTGNNSATKIMAYAYYYNMGLWNDFTFFLNDPVHGDQFEQRDTRWVQGLKATRTWFGNWGNFPMQNTLGLDIRDDIIHDGLFHTMNREVISVVRVDNVEEPSAAPYFENKIQWLPWFRTVAGYRQDFYMMRNETYLSNNSGTVLATVPEPKLSAIFGPWDQTEFYLNAGQGFHSNDARGANTTLDPTTGLQLSRAKPLPRSQGGEVGVRTLAIPNLQSTVTCWVLDLDSELVFDGDTGTTEATGPSRRYGVEWANYYTPTKWLTIDADFAQSQAFYRGHPVGGGYVPEAAGMIINSGVTVHDIYGFTSTLRLRYFGPRPLVQDGSEWSRNTTLLYFNLIYKINPTWEIEGDIFNLLNTKAPDITYYYANRLPGEPAQGVNDFTYHAAEPRTFRLALTAHF